MSNREMAKSLIDMLPDWKMGYVLAFLQGAAMEEMDDDAFCRSLLREYEADPDKGEAVTLEEAARLLAPFPTVHPAGQGV